MGMWGAGQVSETDIQQLCAHSVRVDLPPATRVVEARRRSRGRENGGPPPSPAKGDAAWVGDQERVGVGAS